MQNKYYFDRDKDRIVIGEENCVMLWINSRNDGEGAYEAELHIKIPPEADYTGVERNNKVINTLAPAHWEGPRNDN